jgi:hypothetical protein
MANYSTTLHLGIMEVGIIEYLLGVTKFFDKKTTVVYMPCEALRSGLYKDQVYAWLHLMGSLFP